MSQVTSSTSASNPPPFFCCKYLMRLPLSRHSRMSSTRLLLLSMITQTNWRCFFLGQFVDPQALDRLEGRRRRLLLLAFDVVVVPAGQGTFRHLIQSGDIGDVGETDQPSDVSQEAFAGVSTGSDSRVSRGEIALTTLTLVLGRANDDLHGLLPQREILHGFGVVAAMNRVAGVTTLRTDSDPLHRNNREADRILWRVAPFMHHPEPGQVQRLGPEGQPVILAHISPRHLFSFLTPSFSSLSYQVASLAPSTATLTQNRKNRIVRGARAGHTGRGNRGRDRRTPR